VNEAIKDQVLEELKKQGAHVCNPKRNPTRANDPDAAPDADTKIVGNLQ